MVYGSLLKNNESKIASCVLRGCEQPDVFAKWDIGLCIMHSKVDTTSGIKADALLITE